MRAPKKMMLINRCIFFAVFGISWLSFVVILSQPAVASQREKPAQPAVRALAVAAETKAEMARYSFKGEGDSYENNCQ